jgi:hypothetical protein
MKHLVRKQVIAVNLDARQDAFSINNKSGIIIIIRSPRSRKGFDELSTDDEIIDIDKRRLTSGIWVGKTTALRWIPIQLNGS